MDEPNADDEHYKLQMQIRCHPMGKEQWEFDLYLLSKYANDTNWRFRLENEFPAIPDPEG